LFLLNQFFAEMSAALTATRGHYAQFNGDGLMALYGRDGNVSAGARDALRGGLEMLARLARLNQRLRAELSQPMQIGIGIHTGTAIVGTMGPPGAPIDSAVGDNVNIAARLESMTRTLGTSLVVSAETLSAAEMDETPFRREQVEIRGRRGDFPIYALRDREALAERLVR